MKTQRWLTLIRKEEEEREEKESGRERPLPHRSVCVCLLRVPSSASDEMIPFYGGDRASLLCYILGFSTAAVIVTGTCATGPLIRSVLPAWMIERLEMFLWKRGLVLLAYFVLLDVENVSVGDDPMERLLNTKSTVDLIGYATASYETWQVFIGLWLQFLLSTWQYLVPSITIIYNNTQAIKINKINK